MEADSRGPRAPLVSRRAARTLYVIAGLAAALVFVVDVTGVFGWTVTSNAAWAIGVLLVIPIADRLRKVKFGDFEAEIAERVNQVEERVADLGDASDEANAEEVPTALEWAAKAGDSSSLDRIVWVDDNPDRNRLYVAELRRRFDVITVTSTKEGLRDVGKQPDSTAVITDAVREEGGRVNRDAGADLLTLLKSEYPQVPVYVFCGPATASRQAAALEQAGARLVTWSWQELAATVRADAHAAFEAHVGAVLRERFERVEAQGHGGVDFVVHSGTEEIGVEAKDWRRRPTQSAFDTATTMLARLVEEGRIGRAVLVAPRDVFAPNQIARVPPGVMLVSVAHLASAFGPPPTAET
jgi:CheY-like chemotaxis protein